MKVRVAIMCMAIAGFGTLGIGQPGVVRADQGGNGKGLGIETACAAHVANNGQSHAYGLECPVVTVTCPASTGTVGTPYSSSIIGGGGFPPYQIYAASSLPAGLSLDAATGAIAGTPTTAGTTTFTASVTDRAGQSATATCSLVVSPAPITTAIVLTQTFNGDGTFTLTLTGSGLQPGSEIDAHNITFGITNQVGYADASGNFSVSSTLGCTASPGQLYYTGTDVNGQPYTSPTYSPQPCP